MSTTAHGNAQLYYDRGRGIREADSVKLPIIPDGEWHTYRFPLPPTSYRMLRFDPADASGVFSMRDMKIVDGNWETTHSFDTDILVPARDIAASERSNGTIRVTTTEETNDPILEAVVDIDLNRTFAQNAMVVFGFLAPIFSVITFLTVLTVLMGGWVARAGAARPKRTIAVVGLIATVVSTYPVIFANKSYVSPCIHGVAMLYDTQPFAPGGSCSTIVEERRSDVGAMPWYSLPVSSIESRAVRDGEFPLWNRYVSFGLPLFGQGQSMFLDPLHWLTLLSKDNAWGWDAKFILSKASFVIGIGWLVLLATGSTGSAAVLTVSSAFISFFAYRYNHPATFLLTYAPWILYFWLSLLRAQQGDGEAAHAATPRWAMAGLILTSVLLLNAGAPKEGSITFLTMHAAGALALFLSDLSWRRKVRLVVTQGAMVVAVTLLTAPYWATFLDTLKVAQTSYDIPTALFALPHLLMVVADTIFCEMLKFGLGYPSYNLFVALCVVAALAGAARKRRDPVFLAVALTSVAEIGIAFGAVPADVIVKIPFIANIFHIGNTFLTASIVPVLMLAGYGAARLMRSEEDMPAWLPGVVALVLLAGVAAHVSSIVWHRYSLLFPVFSISIAALLVTAALALLTIVARNRLDRRWVWGLAVCFVVLHVRQGMELSTGVKKLDDFTFQSANRYDTAAPSPAVEVLKRQPGPYRVVGEGGLLFPGYNALLGLESINAAEAVFSPYYWEVMEALELRLEDGWSWLRLIRHDDWPRVGPALDFLNVRYALTIAGAPAPAMARKVASADLDVWERPQAWPRAFFVNLDASYRTAEELAGFVNAEPAPFAAIQDPAAPLRAPAKDRVVIPAHDYRLGTNDTAFRVTVPGPGLIVLQEAYWPGAMAASLNGAPAETIRINHAFRGVRVEAAGAYDVIFGYVPPRWQPSWLLALAGLGVAIALMRFDPSLRPRPGRQ